MTAGVRLYPAFLTQVPVGAVSVVSMYGPLDSGGRITNPTEATDQGLADAEPLYVSLVGPAGLAPSGSTFELNPGDTLSIPAGTTTDVWVNAASSGHKFSAYASSVAVPFAPPTGTFPPLGPTTVTKVIPAYLYQEYNDDEDCQAFFSSLNGLTQEDIDWFVETGLPVYTGLSGELLDWVGAGLYGMFRPALPSGRNRDIGVLNTWMLNTIPLNDIEIIGNQNYYATSDDVYKRILTWHIFKGDGKVFDVRWLKRRIMRFLTGVNGGAGNPADTTPVSVTFGGGNQVNIRIGIGTRRVIGGALLNTMGLNTFGPIRYAHAPIGPLNSEALNVQVLNHFNSVNIPPGPVLPGYQAAFGVTLNSILSVFTPTVSVPLAPILQAAIESGACELPFQFTYVVTVAN